MTKYICSRKYTYAPTEPACLIYSKKDYNYAGEEEEKKKPKEHVYVALEECNSLMFTLMYYKVYEEQWDIYDEQKSSLEVRPV